MHEVLHYLRLPIHACPFLYQLLPLEGLEACGLLVNLRHYVIRVGENGREQR